MTTRRADPIHYLADENAIGLAKVLIREHGRTDVRHVGQAELPEIPRGHAGPAVAGLGRSARVDRPDP